MVESQPLHVPLQYCTTADGVRIGYAEAGAGPPLVLVLGWINPIEYQAGNDGT